MQTISFGKSEILKLIEVIKYIDDEEGFSDKIYLSNIYLSNIFWHNIN